jgi:hypothetical protein
VIEGDSNDLEDLTFDKGSGALIVEGSTLVKDLKMAQPGRLRVNSFGIVLHSSFLSQLGGEECTATVAEHQTVSGREIHCDPAR